MLVVAGLLLAGSLLIWLDLWFGLRQLPQLLSLPAQPHGPMVSIIVAARDEARGIADAVESFLAQDYESLEVIGIDDRSSDGTGGILDRLAREDPRLRVMHVTDLPAGWLGKNHALAMGAGAARGEWLLFTDGDVVLEPGAVGRAVGHATASGFDHVTILPDLLVPGYWLQVFVTAFAVWGLAAARPWRVGKPGSQRHVGVGAFNLVRASSYRGAGGHEAIRLRPDDDLKLGKLLLRSGARTTVLRGLRGVRVEWYSTLGAAIDGLMKNSFAVVEYHATLALGGVLLYLVAGLGPLGVIIAGGAAAKALGAAALVFQVLAAWTMSREVPTRAAAALMFPAGCLLLGWVVLRATVLTLGQKGIRWRGTFYSLEELRRNRI